MSRTVESVVRQMVASDIMTEQRMTPQARQKGLRDYADLVLEMIYNRDHARNLRLQDGIAHMQRMAQEKGLENALVVTRAIDDLNIIEQEISMIPRDEKGMDALHDAVRQSRRKYINFRNVLLRDGDGQARIDQLLIISNGILILEAKDYGQDVVIGESGQICDSSGSCRLTQSLGEQMEHKRALLYTQLEKVLAENNWDIPIHIDSRVVFTNSTALVVDHFQKEKTCYNANLPYEIEQFASDVSYNPHEMFTLGKAVEKLFQKPEECDVGMDFNQIRRNFAAALILLEKSPVVYTIPIQEAALGDGGTDTQNAIDIPDEEVIRTNDQHDDPALSSHIQQKIDQCVDATDESLCRKDDHSFDSFQRESMCCERYANDCDTSNAGANEPCDDTPQKEGVYVVETQDDECREEHTRSSKKRRTIGLLAAVGTLIAGIRRHLYEKQHR